MNENYSAPELIYKNRWVAKEVAAAIDNFPVVVLPAPFSYISAPITLAGEILQCNAELLGALAITQLINPGTSFIFGNAKSVADIKTGEYLIGTPECNLFRVASAQLANYYNIPSHSIGPDTDANQIDMQNGFVMTITKKLAKTILHASQKRPGKSTPTNLAKNIV